MLKVEKEWRQNLLGPWQEAVIDVVSTPVEKADARAPRPLETLAASVGRVSDRKWAR